MIEESLSTVLDNDSQSYQEYLVELGKDAVDDIEEEEDNEGSENPELDIKEEKEDTDEDKKQENSETENEYKPDPNKLSLFLSTECKFQEYNRKTIKFMLYSDNVQYEGKPLKQMDKDVFIFEIIKPLKKLKKISVNDISLFV